MSAEAAAEGKDNLTSDTDVSRSHENVVVAVKDAMKIYRTAEIDTAALRGVSLSIHEGEMVCVVGPSGSGKTTMVNVIGGVTRPDSGSVYWAANKRDISRLTEREITEARRRFIGFIFQTYIISRMAQGTRLKERQKISNPKLLYF